MAGEQMEIIVSGPLQALLARGAQVAHEEVLTGTEHSLLIMQQEVIRRHDRGVSGVLRGGIQTEIRGRGLDVTGRVFSPVAYAMPHEEGGRPHWAPLRNIERWAARVRGGDSKRFARAVWIIISKRGTKAQPKWRPAFLAKAAAVKARMERIFPDIDKRLRGLGR